MTAKFERHLIDSRLQNKFPSKYTNNHTIAIDLPAGTSLLCVHSCKAIKTIPL